MIIQQEIFNLNMILSISICCESGMLYIDFSYVSIN